MKKAKKASTQHVAQVNAPTVPAVPQVDPGLINTIGALKAMASTYNLIESGSYKLSQQPQAMASLAAIRSIYEDLRANIIAHPDCNKTPEGRELVASEAAKDKQEEVK